jgi:hypothetical protein
VRLGSIGGVTIGGEPPSALLNMEDGVPVLHSGQPMGLHVINDTLELVRLERDLSSFGTV